MFRTVCKFPTQGTTACKRFLSTGKLPEYSIFKENTLVNLVSDLKSTLKDAKTEQDVDIKTTLNLFRYYQPNEAEWSKYALRNENVNGHYTRNLVANISDFAKLLILVWEPNTRSKIHNHPSSNCFMKILKGSIQEDLYQSFESKIALQRSTTLPYNSVAYITDNIGIHQMKNTTKELAVSLHLYVPNYEECDIYDENGHVQNVGSSGYYSVGGEKVSPNVNTTV